MYYKQGGMEYIQFLGDNMECITLKQMYHALNDVGIIRTNLSTFSAPVGQSWISGAVLGTSMAILLMYLFLVILEFI